MMDDRRVGVSRRIQGNFDANLDRHKEQLSFSASQRQQLGNLEKGDGILGDSQNGGLRLNRFGKFEILTPEYAMFGTSDPNGTGSNGSNGSNGSSNPDPYPPVPDWKCCQALSPYYFPWMEPGEEQTLLQTRSLFGCVYLWEIVGCTPDIYGCGSLRSAPKEISGIIYTAPSFSGCGKEVVVEIRDSVISSDGRKPPGTGTDGNLGTSYTGPRACKSEFTISVKSEDCARPDCQGSIAYTSTTMSVGTSQNLSVSDPTEGQLYYWSLSGGGSLSEKYGISTVYTAPANNPNCKNNATISLMCNGTLLDTLKIAINAYPENAAAFQYWHIAHGTGLPDCRHVDYAGWCYWVVGPKFNCTGVHTNNNYVNNPYSGATEAGCAQAYANVIAGDGRGYAEHAYQDVRTAEMIENGCCPAELL